MENNNRTADGVLTHPYVIVCRGRVPVTSVRITQTEATKLELTLNLSDYGRLWVKFGDMMYKLSTSPSVVTQYVSKKQYDWMLNELKKMRLK